MLSKNETNPNVRENKMDVAGMYRVRLVFIAALLMPLLALDGCGYNAKSQNILAEKSMEKLTSSLRTQCVGRYLIDLPDGATVSSTVKINGIQVTAKAMSEKRYKYSLDERAKELKHTKSRYKYFYADGNPDIKNGRYFIFLGTVENDCNRVIEAYKWERGYQIKVSIEGTDWTQSVMKDDPAVKAGIQTDVEPKKMMAFALLKILQPRMDSEIPTEPGFCFPGGFFPGGATSTEKMMAGLNIPGHDDVYLSLETDPQQRETESLLQRSGQINRAMALVAHAKTLRAGKVRLKNLDAEEWIYRQPSRVDAFVDTFQLEANMTIGSAATPALTLLFSVGWPPNSNYIDPDKFVASLDEDESLVLWDAISRTLRPRPKGF